MPGAEKELRAAAVAGDVDAMVTASQQKKTDVESVDEVHVPINNHNYELTWYHFICCPDAGPRVAPGRSVACFAVGDDSADAGGPSRTGPSLQGSDPQLRSQRFHHNAGEPC